MSTTIIEDYLQEVKNGLNDQRHRNFAEGISEHYKRILQNTDSFFERPQLLAQRAIFSKYKVINNLEKYLVEFEFLFTRHGGKIIWASDHEEATKEILRIIKEKEAKRVVKANSKTVQEIGLKKILEDNHIECIETELNAFINQLKSQSSPATYMPILDMDFDNAQKELTKRLNIPEKNVSNSFDFAKKYLVNLSSQTKVGIYGVNYLVSDIGGLVLCENTGNISMVTSFPEVQIAVAGIDKMIPCLSDLEKFLHLLSTHTNGRMLPWQTQIITGPRQEGETDGPTELYLVLIDNKRTEVLKQVNQREIFYCIHCGACTSVCPVYKFIGPVPYGETYVGPVGAVVNPFMQDFYNAAHQSFACTLCRRCTEVCPMKIPLHELILRNRKEAVQREYYIGLDRTDLRYLRKMLLKRAQMDAYFCNFILRFRFKKYLGLQRSMPDLTRRSFNIRYKELYSTKS